MKILIKSQKKLQLPAIICLISLIFTCFYPSVLGVNQWGVNDGDVFTYRMYSYFNNSEIEDSEIDITVKIKITDITETRIWFDYKFYDINGKYNTYHLYGEESVWFLGQNFFIYRLDVFEEVVSELSQRADTRNSWINDKKNEDPNFDGSVTKFDYGYIYQWENLTANDTFYHEINYDSKGILQKEISESVDGEIDTYIFRTELIENKIPGYSRLYLCSVSLSTLLWVVVQLKKELKNKERP